jgi:hypothetical protein
VREKFKTFFAGLPKRAESACALHCQGSPAELAKLKNQKFDYDWKGLK